MSTTALHIVVLLSSIICFATGLADGFDVCDCLSMAAQTDEDGISCLPSLEAGVKAGGEIHVGGTYRITSPISFENDIIIIGHVCGNLVAKLEATFNGSAMFVPTGLEQVIEFRNLELTSAKGRHVSAVRGLGDENNSGSQTLSLRLQNVKAYDFMSEKAGGVFFLGNARDVLMDSASIFTNNRVSSSVDDRYAGGGVIAIINANTDSKLIFDSTFTQNSALYPGGSEHANGGAIYLDWMEGYVQLSGNFMTNQANQGGGVHVQAILGTIEANGNFVGNRAVDTGAGARAGALRILNHYPGSVVVLSGRFEENTADGRSGVMAVNSIQKGALIRFTGIFRNNKALGGNGGVFSQWSSQDIAGTVEFSAEAAFEGNTASNAGTSIAGTASGYRLDEDDWLASTVKI